uniref:Transcriptional regulator n=1 Tax=Brugia timori TaxID=42155 RepID=A0A0R3QYY8_9BILA
LCMNKGKEYLWNYHRYFYTLFHQHENDRHVSEAAQIAEKLY